MSQAVYTKDDIDGEFQANGKISEIVSIPDEPSELQGRALTEYESGPLSKVTPLS